MVEWGREGGKCRYLLRRPLDPAKKEKGGLLPRVTVVERSSTATHAVGPLPSPPLPPLPRSTTVLFFPFLPWLQPARWTMEGGLAQGGKGGSYPFSFLPPSPSFLRGMKILDVRARRRREGGIGESYLRGRQQVYRPIKRRRNITIMMRDATSVGG